jgi:prolyl oligopeptidase
VAVNLDQPEPEHWRTLLPQTDDTLITAVRTRSRIVALSLHDAASRLRSYALDGGNARELPLPGIGSVGEGLGASTEDDELFFGYSSFALPSTPYRADAAKGSVQAFRRLKLAFDPSQYVTEQVFYTSRDTTRVPMFISYKKGLKRDGRARAFLHGYGGFNIAKTPAFDVSALAWMEQGGIYAVANLRGGGEYGESWHRAGTQARQQNVFDDFVAAAGYLVAKRYTDYPRIAIWGRSNGGLLIGASVNQRPALWGAAVATVGVMDMLRFHKFTVGYAWTGDYGSSDETEGFEYLFKYSPLHNVVPGTRYPPTLITTGDHDDRVHPGHSYKYAAAMQAAQAGEAPVLIRIDTRAGHGAGKPVAKIVEEEADKLAFMWRYTDGEAR